MKRALILFACAALCAGILCASACAEIYPIYEVDVYPAYLRGERVVSAESILCVLPRNSQVLVVEARDGWCLVCTRDRWIGYAQSDYLKPTGKTCALDFSIGEADISSRDETRRMYITVAPEAVLPEPSVLQGIYPATLTRGEPLYDLPFLLDTLLGPGYETERRGERITDVEYRSTAPDRPRRFVRFFDEYGKLNYYDAMVTGNRFGEYEPPRIDMTRDESLPYCRALLKGVVRDEWLEHPGIVRGLVERWVVRGRRMSDAEYEAYMRRADAHYIVFEHWSDDGVRILDDELLAVVGANGLSELIVNWHDFRDVGSDRASLMPLEAAIEMANTTRLAPAVLICAQPVYSNWLTQSAEYNLSWHLVTNQGNYVVDCVRNEHMCDSYEY